MDSFSKKLRVVLAEKGWTQRRLAKETGIDKSEISRYCKGATRPKLENLRKLADALGLAVVALEPSLDVSCLPPPPSEPGELIRPSASAAIERKILELLRGLSPETQVEILVHLAKRYGAPLEPPSSDGPSR